MKILVAGGAGYIGSALIPRLVNRGYDVEVLDLMWFGNKLPSDVKIIRKNIFDLTEDDLKEYTQVIFLAGLSNDPMAEFSPSLNFIYNASAPAFLAYLAKKANVRRYIYAGSCSVYGYTVNQLYDEESPTVCNYPYGISKLQGEKAVMQMIEPNFSVICFRQGTVSGYSPRMRFDLIVNSMFRAAVLNKKIYVSNPSIWRPILSIDDAVSAYIRAIESNNDISGVFNIASGNYTVGEVADLVKDKLDAEFNLNLKLDINRIDDYRNYKVSIDRAMNILSFKPKHGVESIIQDLIAHLKEFNDFSDTSYYNIQVFKSMTNLHFSQL